MPQGKFQSTRPVRGATVYKGLDTSSDVFQSTRPVRGATDATQSRMSPLTLFQSTRPVRGATCCSTSRVSAAGCFNPRAPCGARLASHGMM